MGQLRKSPIIVEFNGLPGSGKTTVANHVKELLQPSINVPIYSEYYRKSFHSNPYSVLLSVNYYRLLLDTIKFSRSFANKRPIAVEMNVCKYMRMYEQFIADNKEGMLIIDEGVIQMLVSVAFNNPIKDERCLYDFLKKCGFDKVPMLVVNCDLDSYTTSERLEKRLPNGCRLEEMSKIERDNTLKVQNNNFKLVRSAFCEVFPDNCTLTVNTSEDPLLIARTIKDKILSI